MTISHRMNFRSLLLAATIFAGPLAAVTAVPAVAQVACGISAQTAPPLLPVYAQPPIPEAGQVTGPLMAVVRLGCADGTGPIR